MGAQEEVSYWAGPPHMQYDPWYETVYLVQISSVLYCTGVCYTDDNHAISLENRALRVMDGVFNNLLSGLTKYIF